MTAVPVSSEADTPTWRADVDALAFQPRGHRGLCMVHRHAFRTLLRQTPSPEACVAFYHAHVDAFQAAAGIKIQRTSMVADANFHLTSRDLARQIAK
jgi:hypothetical protein